MSKKEDNEQEIVLQDQEIAAEAPKSSNTLVIIYGVLFLITAVGNSVFNIKCIQSASNYSIFISQLTSFIYTPIFLGVVLYTNSRGGITQEMKAYPKFKYFVMSILEGAGGAIYVIGLTKTTPAFSVVLQQLGIPLTLVVATLMLRATFHYLQYGGSLVIMAGVVVFNLNKVLEADDSAGRDMNNFGFNAMVLVGVLLMCVSSVYKEIAFKGVDLDVNLVQYWVAYMQFFITVLCLPLQALPLFPPEERVAFSDLPSVLYDGARCVFDGFNSKASDDCQAALGNTLAYTGFNILYNVFALLLIKHASASFVQVLSAVRLPLATALMYLPFVMGDKATAYSNWHVYGIIIILSGIACYRVGGFLNAKKAKEADVTAGDLMNPAEGALQQSFIQNEIKSHKSTFVASFVGGGAREENGTHSESFIRRRKN